MLLNFSNIVQWSIKKHLSDNFSLQVADRLFSSFGQDILDALYWTATEPKERKRAHIGVIPHFLMAVLYVCILSALSGVPAVSACPTSFHVVRRFSHLKMCVRVCPGHQRDMSASPWEVSLTVIVRQFKEPRCACSFEPLKKYRSVLSTTDDVEGFLIERTVFIHTSHLYGFM